MAFSDDAPVHLLKKKSGTIKRPKQQWVNVGRQKIFARSKWESNYAHFLEHLREHGLIKSWKHEPKEFWFLKIKRGVRSYKPDFKVVEKDGSVVWYEVKGWMDRKSATKLKRMKKYYPDEVVVVISQIWFANNNGIWRGVIPGWEE